MKQKITLVLAIALCFIMAIPTFATGIRKEGIIPGTDETYEYVEFAQVKIPGSDTVFTFENVTATVGYTEKTHHDFSPSEPIPTYRFTILGDKGGFSIDKDKWIVCHYVAENESSFNGDWIYEADYFETFKALPEGNSKGYWTYETTVCEPSESEALEGGNTVACVEIFFGEYVDRVHYGLTSTNNNLLLNDSWEMLDIETFMINNDVEPDYQIIAGANAQWESDSKAGLTIKSDGDFNKFTGVKIDDELIDESKYIAKEGSTIVELKADYLKTLKVGEHEITLLYSDGEVTTNFEVKKVNSENININNNNPVIPNTSAGVKKIGGLIVASVVSLLAIVLITKNKHSRTD